MDVPEYEVEEVSSGSVGVATFDQDKQMALDWLRRSDGFIVCASRPGEAVIDQLVMLPGGKEWAPLRRVFISTLETLVADLREAEEAGEL